MDNFEIEIVDPCLTTSITAPTLPFFSVEDGKSLLKTFTDVIDTVDSTYTGDDLCGDISYEVVDKGDSTGEYISWFMVEKDTASNTHTITACPDNESLVIINNVYTYYLRSKFDDVDYASATIYTAFEV